MECEKCGFSVLEFFIELGKCPICDHPISEEQRKAFLKKEIESTYVDPQFKGYQTGIVLCANDVIADVLLVDFDEEGARPRTIVRVNVPEKWRHYRRDTLEGKSWFKRGDRVGIECTMTKIAWQHSEEEIQGLIDWFQEIEEDNADFYLILHGMAKNFDREWQELCARDLKKRVEEPEER